MAAWPRATGLTLTLLLSLQGQGVEAFVPRTASTAHAIQGAAVGLRGRGGAWDGEGAALAGARKKRRRADSSRCWLLPGADPTLSSLSLHPQARNLLVAGEEQKANSRRLGHSGPRCSSTVGSAAPGDVTPELMRVVAELDNPDGVDEEAFSQSLALYYTFQDFIASGCGQDAVQGVRGGEEGEKDGIGCLSEGSAELALRVAEALQRLADALRLYGPEKLVGSYNGGKDAVVIMHLQRAAVAKYSLDRGRMHRARVIYFENPKDFPEIKALVKASKTDYDLDVLTYDTGFVKGLTQCMSDLGGGTFAFTLGTRKGDPNCGTQGPFTPSSDWMPPFMRVNPIIDWDYGQIWTFLRKFKLPYPSLYDEGYTSLGSVEDTQPNPALKRPGGSGYYPAHMLVDWDLERAGRLKKGEKNDEAEAVAPAQEEEEEEEEKREGGPGRLSCKSVGLVIVGDEILKGKCVDSNTKFAAEAFWKRGIPIQRVTVVCDTLEDITAEVRKQAQAYDIVLTSGGIGPTHDDITIKAVGAALGQPITQSEEMLGKLVTAFKVQDQKGLTEAQLKMALLPERAVLRLPSPGKGKAEWPILQCENVFVLPGVPQFFEQKVRVITEDFVRPNNIANKMLVLSADEFSIADRLNDAVREHEGVTFGSYPFFENPLFKTVITLEGSELEVVEAGLVYLQSLLAEEDVVKVVDGTDLSSLSTKV